jgi:hypothetical protein
MILGGPVLFAQYYPKGGFQNPYTGMGLSLFCLGWLVKWFGQILEWWHR